MQTVTAVELILQSNFSASTMELYKKVAERYNTTPGRVERNIRYLFEAAYGKNNTINSQTLFKLAYKIKFKGE